MKKNQILIVSYIFIFIKIYKLIFIILKFYVI